MSAILFACMHYIRWHGRGAHPWYNYHYSPEELQEWVPRVQKVSKGVHKVCGYFNNHYHGYAAENCLEILELLNISEPQQVCIKEKIIQYNLKDACKKDQ